MEILWFQSENYTDPEILKYSPAGSLPFLVIDGVVYKETVALMRYLCGKVSFSNRLINVLIMLLMD